MSKITFRADDDLVERLEALDTSKSEAMREALRTYLDGADRDDTLSDTSDAEPMIDLDAESSSEARSTDSIDEAIRERVDELVADRLDERLGRTAPAGRTQDLNVNISLDGVNAEKTSATDEPTPSTSSESERKTKGGTVDEHAGAKTCDKCGERVEGDHVYCPNCGEKASHRVFCECGDELRSDWAFCPSCGRRTSAADVLERT
ncbi:double zinc ribbon domain-containing protein [Halobellus limi]|uniref:Ribbon-helix-helix protein, CopG family n=1 Tax=Halobellus limi TaxID=699433 RepID=A0A1H5YMB5_9EURY|nr:zinc ribbon domain-containing protein [Halobellus limi]QCC48408.1 ribbon-helix-helix protein, CopG family [Halobellus limi]SEG24890.1 Ribbon-helix-helix protein, copG family [Halobellus limi]